MPRSSFAGLRSLRFLPQTALFALGFALLKELPSGETQTDHKSGRDGAAGGEHEFVPANEFLEPVEFARRSRHYRFAVQKTPHVHRETIGRLVTARAILLQALHHDPVQVTANQMDQ